MPAKCANDSSRHAIIEIPQADPAWKLIMQSGAVIDCTVGIYLNELLQKEFGLSEEQLKPVDALLLDGMPVDEPEETIVPDRARLALASALPGIAGLAMRKGSPVRGLRSGITHSATGSVTGNPDPKPGHISLFLYSLTLPQLAGHFLERGVIVSTAQVRRYARFAPDDSCRFNGETVKAGKLEKLLPDEATCFFKCKVMS